MGESLISYWIIVGIVLMLLEIIIPGGVVIFLGIASVLVGLTLWSGLIEGWVQGMTLWFIYSLVLLICFRQVTQRLIGGDSHVDETDEDFELYDKKAIVKTAIGPGKKLGRVEYNGVEWPALGDGTTIDAGNSVRIICRENIALVVELDSKSTHS